MDNATGEAAGWQQLLGAVCGRTEGWVLLAGGYKRWCQWCMSRGSAVEVTHEGDELGCGVLGCGVLVYQMINQSSKAVGI